jgi:alpha-glucosidase (family GH31 glycosyl hydrolase)
MTKTFLFTVLLLAAAACVGQSPAPTEKPASYDTTTPAIAPPWSMEPWFWEDDVNTAAAVWDLINGCKENNLPLGAVLLDSPWATAYNNFAFDEKRYPDPRGLIAQWHKMGIRTVLWMGNTMNTKEDKADAAGSDEDLYTFGKQHGYFVNNNDLLKWWKGRGAMIDYTNWAAVAWWHRLMDRALALDIDGWKVDGTAEMFMLTKRQSSRGTLEFLDYLDLYYRDTLHYGRAYKPDFVTMVRSVDIANMGGLAIRHAPFDAAPLTWTGDQRHSWTDKGLDEALRSVSRALEMGYPSASSDTGGYQTPKGPDKMPRLVFLRWAQWNALTPFFINGGHDEHRPWKFDAAFLEIFRRYMWLHHELIPFYYSQHVQAALREGQLMHPGPRADEYLLGDAFLVGVMTNEKPEREIAFPSGTWLDYWDNKVSYRGGQSVQVQVPEARSPIFVRTGAIVPLNVENNIVSHGDAASKGWITLDIYPGEQASRAAVWNTAVFPPRAGQDRTDVLCEPTASGLTITMQGGAPRDTLLRVWSPKPATIAGLPRSAWHYDAADQRLWVRLPKAHNVKVVVTQ